jgi:hypothetical protein
MLQTDWSSVNSDWYKFYQEWGVRIRYSEDRRPIRSSADAKFFLKLSLSGIIERFTQLKLSTRKFPQPPVSFVGRTLAHEILAILVNHCGQHPSPFGIAMSRIHRENPARADHFGQRASLETRTAARNTNRESSTTPFISQSALTSSVGL